MKTKWLSLIFLAGASVWSQPVVKKPKLLFIGIDGVRSDALRQIDTPTLDSLMAAGTYTFDSWHLGITSSGPSWSSMMTGVWEAKHNVRSNTYAGANFTNYPYFPNRVKQFRPDVKAVQIITWNQMGEKDINPGGYVFNSKWDKAIDAGNHSQKAVTNAAKIQLLDEDLDILFIHYDEVDATGHASGFNPTNANYISNIKKVDSELAEVIQALKDRETYDQEDWMILATTDHGGTGTSHGGNSNTERQIWWFASGGGMPKLQITGSDPGSYQIPNRQPKLEDIKNVPVLTDIAVTAIAHMLRYAGPNNSPILPDTVTGWNLDGKSWVKYEEVTSVENDRFSKMDDFGFGVFPNPNEGVFKIALKSVDAGGANYSLLSPNGNIILNGMFDITSMLAELDISDLPKGIYSLKVVNGSKVTVRKVIKK
ncbi:MAG: alkaline phosphatase family protein [Cytophagales bacterium]